MAAAAASAMSLGSGRLFSSSSSSTSSPSSSHALPRAAAPRLRRKAVRRAAEARWGASSGGGGGGSNKARGGSSRRGEEGEQVVSVMWPTSFDEVPQAIAALREGSSVVMNLSSIASIEEQQRCVDFVAGGCFAMNGHQDTLSDSVFLFLPAGVSAANINSRREALLCLGSTQLALAEDLAH
eukprot:jgi/Chlat1/4981/Chrsp32S04959